MTATLRQFGLAGALVFASAALPLVIRHGAQVKWREKDDSLRQQAGQLEQLSAENERLSNLVAQAKNSGSISADALRELMRLRGEIGQLRQAVSERERLRAQNQRLLALPEGPGGPSRARPPEAQAIQDYWPRNQLAFAGYSEPPAALKTALWAMSLGDTQALASVLTPEATDCVIGGQRDRAASEMAASARSIADSLAPASGFYISGQKLAAPDRTIFDVYFEGEGKTRKVALKKIGNEWKFDALGRAGDSDEDLDSGRGWP